MSDPNFPGVPPPYEDIGPEAPGEQFEYQVYMHRKAQELETVNRDIGCLRRLLEDLGIKKQRLLKELGS